MRHFVSTQYYSICIEPRAVSTLLTSLIFPLFLLWDEQVGAMSVVRWEIGCERVIVVVTEAFGPKRS